MPACRSARFASLGPRFAGGPGTHPDIDVREEWARTSERVIDRRGQVESAEAFGIGEDVDLWS
jgi:hypothetical protein